VSAVLRKLTALRPATLRGAVWAWLACGRARRQLRAGGLDGVRLPPAPPARAAARGVGIALRARRASCLESALVRQAMYAARGVHRDLVIGVSAPSAGFGAHAWLEGDPAAGAQPFAEIVRHVG
jgi:hypothetical protein